MTDGETRFHMLSMCKTLREQLKQTEKLTSAVEMLLARDPELKAQYDAAQNQRHNGEKHSGTADSAAEKILLQLQQEIQTLGGENWA